jgi:hypothetical protein
MMVQARSLPIDQDPGAPFQCDEEDNDQPRQHDPSFHITLNTRRAPHVPASMTEIPNGVRYTLDAVAGVAAFAALAKILPPIAAALSIVWLLIQLSEWAYGKIRK